MRTSKLTEKDMEVLRETEGAKTAIHSTFTQLKDYSLQHRVVIRRDLNEDAIKDRMFELSIDDYTVILDYEEFLKFGRFI